MLKMALSFSATQFRNLGKSWSWPDQKWQRLGLLSLTMVILHGLEQRSGLHGAGGLVCGFTFMGMLIGSVWLTPLAETSLGVLFLGLFSAAHRPEQTAGAAAFMAQLLIRAGFVGGCIALSHRHRALEQARAEALRQQKEYEQRLRKGLRICVLTHELRQPLSQLELHTRLSQHRLEHGGCTPQAIRQSLLNLEASVHQISRIIAAIGDLNRERQTPPLPLSLTSCVNHVLHRLKPRLNREGIDLQLHGFQQGHATLGHALQVQIVCANLIENAVDALMASRVAQRVIAISLERDGAMILLRVEDSGAGLPTLELQQLILNSTKPDGMGLGLQTVQMIAAHHHGSLSLGRSSSLGGACLELRLPAQA